MSDRAPRLGDVIDDYCPRCRLLLNHDVTSLFDDAVAKVTCRTCHNTHDYRHAQVPAKRQVEASADKQSLMDQVLAAHADAARAAGGAGGRAEPQKRDLWAEVERLKEEGTGVRAVDVIQKKRDGGELRPEEIDFFDRAATPRARCPTTRPRRSPWPSSSGA